MDGCFILQLMRRRGWLATILNRSSKIPAFMTINDRMSIFAWLAYIMYVICRPLNTKETSQQFKAIIMYKGIINISGKWYAAVAKTTTWWSKIEPLVFSIPLPSPHALPFQISSVSGLGCWDMCLRTANSRLPHLELRGNHAYFDT